MEIIMTDNIPKPIFRNLAADDPDPEATEIESLCINCGEDGTTRMLLTKIPFYKEVIIMSFECPHCGYQNNELQPGGKIEDKGVRITLHVKSEIDLNRQVVKSDYTSVKIPEIDFEIPSQSQKGEVTTLEGILCRIETGLLQDQDKRKDENPEIAKQVDEFLVKLAKLKSLSSPFTMVFEDISGNTFVSNPHMPLKDTNCEVHQFVRHRDQDHILGIYTSAEIGRDGLSKPEPTQFTLEDLEGEVLGFSTNCPNCQSPCQTNMKLTNIPYFREVVIMATVCDVCSHRSNEVKSGGGIEPLGQRITCKVNGREDFSRDVLKSETCKLEIPELNLDVGPGVLGGRFTTIEGLISTMKDQLVERAGVFGDSADDKTKTKMDAFIEEVEKVLAGKKQVTLILDDPAGNSYVQSLTYPEEDPNITVERYTRSFEHNEELGLNDMKTENYENS